MSANVIEATAAEGASVAPEQVRDVVAQACPAKDFTGKRVLLIVPDATRTAPVGLLFKTIHEQIGAACRECDVMFALGTHPPMSEEAMCARLEISAEERRAKYGCTRLLNHAWDNPVALVTIGTISAEEISALTGGLFAMDVPVSINRRVFDYDQLILVGPVFPHEVVGFSGGNKYLFPGVSGPEVLNFFHWLGAVVTNPMIIGNKWTPVRKVVDHAASMVRVDKLCFALVVKGAELAGLYAGTPDAAWDRASELSRRLHLVYKERPFQTVLSCAPTMYDELWVGGKCMYKLEPVVADGGELIIYAPHIHEVSVVHGHLIEAIGYHCVDYFLKQWGRFKDLPWGTLAHSTHVRGIGHYDADTGVEHCRVRVTLATGIRREVCERINLGYRDPATIDVESFADREDEGVLLVRKAGEMLYHLSEPPAWAGGSTNQGKQMSNPLTGQFVVMGVSGCGKSSVASLLASRTAGRFLDADDFHSPENKAKMSAGIPLTDEDRWPWLESLNRELRKYAESGRPVFLACSALRQSYRERLSVGLSTVRYIYLKGSKELIRQRMQSREDHFMPSALLDSQFAALEEPQDAVVASIDEPLSSLVELLLPRLSDGRAECD